MDSPPPPWFARAIASPGESRFVEVAGASIHYLQWGGREKPGLLFVPASGGHAHWFDHVAPFFADRFNVAVIDLSGCGDSDRRAAYSQDLITDEIMAVCGDAGMLAGPVPPTVVGHSAGAQFAMRAAVANDEALLGVIAVDGLRYAELEKDHAIKALSGDRKPVEPRPAKVYASLEEAAARFRLRPEPLEPIDAPHIIEHIGWHSYRSVEGGWAAKFDPAQAATITLAFDMTEALVSLQCRSASLYCDYTHLADETAADAITAISGGRTVVFTIPGTTHYPMIDSPFAFVAAIEGVVLSWIAEAHRSDL